MMKKIVAMLMVCAMVLSMCACASTAGEDKKAIGYVIVPHHDGDEHIAIVSYYTSNGTIVVRTTDEHKIVGTELIVVIKE